MDAELTKLYAIATEAELVKLTKLKAKSRAPKAIERQQAKVDEMLDRCLSYMRKGSVKTPLLRAWLAQAIEDQSCNGVKVIVTRYATGGTSVETDCSCFGGNRVHDNPSCPNLARLLQNSTLVVV